MCKRVLSPAVVLVLILHLVGCGGSDSTALSDAEEQLSENFLRPLLTAEMAYRVQDTCRLALQPADAAWHLQASYLVDAPLREVAETLAAAGVRLNGNRSPVVVQQEPSQPQSGWNGGLESVGQETRVSLTYNHVAVESVANSGGWGEPCPT